MDVEHGGMNLGMTHQLLQRGQGNAGTHHVRAEGVAMGVEKKQEALATANRQIAGLHVEYPRAA